MSPSETALRRVFRIQLGLQLRGWREQAKISSKEAAQAVGVDPSRLSRLEQGAATIRSTEVDQLLTLYKVPADAVESLRALGAEAQRRSGRIQIADWALRFLGLETAASDIKIYDGELVPGLLQTEGYARALLRTGEEMANPNTAEKALDERMRRQERLVQPHPPRVWVVLGEAVLYRAVGGPDVLKGQLERFLELHESRTAAIQILPFDAGEHVALGSSFTIFQLADLATNFVYLEYLTDSVYLDQERDLDFYNAVFNRMLMTAESARDSARRIERRVKQLT